ncbi:MAG: STAS domain-containing protein [Nevskia sp.]|nr:STAS domain-containing protein [Nevskia sp.]
MEISIDQSVQPTCLRLTGTFNIEAVLDAKPRLLAPIDASADGLALDLSQVDDIDTAGLQLLVLAMRHAMAAGKPLRAANISEPVRRLVTLYRLSDHFDTAQPQREAP